MVHRFLLIHCAALVPRACTGDLHYLRCPAQIQQTLAKSAESEERYTKTFPEFRVFPVTVSSISTSSLILYEYIRHYPTFTLFLRSMFQLSRLNQ